MVITNYNKINHLDREINSGSHIIGIQSDGTKRVEVITFTPTKNADALKLTAQYYRFNNRTNQQQL